jgi:hypothetical protein
MQKILRAAVTAVMVLASAALAASVKAMTLAATRPPAAATASQLMPVAVICGIGGCAPVWTKRVHKPSPNFVKRAVPLSAVPASQQQNAAPLK